MTPTRICMSVLNEMWVKRVSEIWDPISIYLYNLYHYDPSLNTNNNNVDYTINLLIWKKLMYGVLLNHYLDFT